VVVATYNRAALLERLLDALAAQEGVARFEVIVVSDASTDATADVLAARAATFPVPLLTMRQERNAGPAAARNRGWRTARAPIIAFTDDDCRPSPRWLASLLAASSPATALVQGRTLPDPDQLDRWGPFSRPFPTVVAEDGFYSTCNIAYRRDVLDALGGFDETFRFPCGEDTDLAWRARKAGYTTAFEGDALVHHEVWRSDWLNFMRSMRRSESLVLLVSIHPELRRHAGVKVFWRGVHLPVLLVVISALLVAVLPQVGPLWFMLGASSLKYWQEAKFLQPNTRRSQAQWAVAMPLLMLADLEEVVVMAWGSLRYRALLL
jgi:GT2 family glycosyltransferase